MSKALIRIINEANQSVAAGSAVNMGHVSRRFGSNLQLNGNAVQADGCGYYNIDTILTVTPAAAGTVIAAIYADGAQLPGAVSSVYAATANQPVAVPVSGTDRITSVNARQYTVMLLGGDGVVNNITTKAVKE